MMHMWVSRMMWYVAFTASPWIIPLIVVRWTLFRRAGGDLLPHVPHIPNIILLRWTLRHRHHHTNQHIWTPSLEILRRLKQWYRDLMGSHIQLAIIGLSLRCVTDRPKVSGDVIHMNIRHLWSWFYYRQITTRYLPKMRWIALLHELTCLELYAHLPNLTATS